MQRQRAAVVLNAVNDADTTRGVVVEVCRQQLAELQAGQVNDDATRESVHANRRARVNDGRECRGSAALGFNLNFGGEQIQRGNHFGCSTRSTRPQRTSSLASSSVQS